MLVTDVRPSIDASELPTAQGEGEVVYRALDVRDEEAWAAARDWVVEHWGGLDQLVNNAGVAAGGRIDVMPVADWEWIVDINLMGVVRGCRTFAPLLKSQGAGHIVNTASLAGLVHPPMMSSYNAVKAGVVALSETLLHELSAYGITVSVICPSFFRTGLEQSLPGSDSAVEESAKTLIGQARNDADTIASRVVPALDKGRFLVLPDAQAQLVVRAKKYATRAYHFGMSRAGYRVANKAAKRAGRGTL